MCPEAAMTERCSGVEDAAPSAGQSARTEILAMFVHSLSKNIAYTSRPVSVLYRDKVINTKVFHS
jgi:hypothetical protein